jgi:hypothetical protein
MNRPTRLSLLALVIITVGCLTAGCAQGANVKKALASSSLGSTASISDQSSPSASSRPVFSPTRTPASPTRTPASPKPRPTVQHTVQHTVTASAAPSATAPSPTSAPAPAGTTSSLWLWILLGAALVIAIVAIVVTRHSRQRSARIASWRSQAADASARGSALYDAISLAGLQESWETANAEARWVDIQRQADELTQLLYRLQDSAPGEEDRLRVADVLASLQAIRSAMEAANIPGGPSAQQGGRMHSLLRVFGESLRALRSPDAYGF